MNMNQKFYSQINYQNKKSELHSNDQQLYADYLAHNQKFINMHDQTKYKQNQINKISAITTNYLRNFDQNKQKSLQLDYNPKQLNPNVKQYNPTSTHNIQSDEKIIGIGNINTWSMKLQKYLANDRFSRLEDNEKHKQQSILRQALWKRAQKRQQPIEKAIQLNISHISSLKINLTSFNHDQKKIFKQSKNKNVYKISQSQKSNTNSQKNLKFSYHRQPNSRRIKSKKSNKTNLQKSLFFYTDNMDINTQAPGQQSQITKILKQYQTFHQFCLPYQISKLERSVIRLSHYGKSRKRNNENSLKSRSQISKPKLNEVPFNNSQFLRREQSTRIKNGNNNNRFLNNNLSQKKRLSQSMLYKTSTNTNRDQIKNQQDDQDVMMKYFNLCSNDNIQEQSRMQQNIVIKQLSLSNSVQNTKRKHNQKKGFRTQMVTKYTTPVRSIHLNRKNNSNSKQKQKQSNKKSIKVCSQQKNIQHKRSQINLERSHFIEIENNYKFQNDNEDQRVLKSNSKQKLLVVSSSKSRSKIQNNLGSKLKNRLSYAKNLQFSNIFQVDNIGVHQNPIRQKIKLNAHKNCKQKQANLKNSNLATLKSYQINLQNERSFLSKSYVINSNQQRNKHTNESMFIKPSAQFSQNSESRKRQTKFQINLNLNQINTTLYDINKSLNYINSNMNKLVNDKNKMSNSKKLDKSESRKGLSLTKSISNISKISKSYYLGQKKQEGLEKQELQDLKQPEPNEQINKKYEKRQLSRKADRNNQESLYINRNNAINNKMEQKKQQIISRKLGRKGIEKNAKIVQIRIY